MFRQRLAIALTTSPISRYETHAVHNFIYLSSSPFSP
jgi:hypothetical protein